MKSLKIGSCLLALSLVGTAAYSADSITVVNYGGSYARACADAYHERFEAATGIKVKLEDYTGGLAEVRAQVDADSIHWDVVHLDNPDHLVGCDEGVLEVLSDLDLPAAPDGTPAASDFFAGSVTECGVGTVIFATVVAYNSELSGENPPSKIADFFDVEAFPGRRGMRRSVAENLLFALLGDGVQPNEVFDVLSTTEGIARAFSKLDSIKEHIVWWEAGAQPPQMLADGEVVMTTGWNGRIFNAQALEKQPFVIIWDGHIRDWSHIGIVANTPRLEAAREFVKFATTTESLVRVGERIAYAPLRKSGLPQIGNHVSADIPMQPHMPTYPQNSMNFVRNDPVWWTERIDELTERFSAWLAK